MDLPEDDSEFTNPITSRRFGLDRMPEYFMARMQQISGARFSPEVMHVKTDTGGRLPGEAPKSIFYKGYEIRMGVVDDEKFWVGIYHPERKVEPDSRVGKALFALNSNTVNHSGGNSYAVFFSNGRRSGSSMENFLVAEYRKRLDDPDTITLGIFTGLRGVVKAIYEEDKQLR